MSYSNTADPGGGLGIDRLFNDDDEGVTGIVGRAQANQRQHRLHAVAPLRRWLH